MSRQSHRTEKAFIICSDIEDKTSSSVHNWDYLETDFSGPTLLGLTSFPLPFQSTDSICPCCYTDVSELCSPCPKL